MLRKFLKPTALTNQVSLAVLILRVGSALLMIPHGYGKWQRFIAGNHDFPDPLHLSPVVSMGLTIFAELCCSVLLLLGLFSRPAALVLSICMAIIALVIHGSDPLGDKELSLLYLAGFLVVLLIGPGKYSLDASLFKK